MEGFPSLDSRESVWKAEVTISATPPTGSFVPWLAASYRWFPALPSSFVHLIGAPHPDLTKIDDHGMISVLDGLAVLCSSAEASTVACWFRPWMSRRWFYTLVRKAFPGKAALRATTSG